MSDDDLPINGDQINDVLYLVRDMTDDGDIQLTIIARALVIGCKSCGVRKEIMLSHVERIFDEADEIIEKPN